MRFNNLFVLSNRCDICWANRFYVSDHQMHADAWCPTSSNTFTNLVTTEGEGEYL